MGNHIDQKKKMHSEIMFVLLLSAVNTALCEFVIRISNPKMLMNELSHLFNSLSFFNGYILQTDHQVRAWIYIFVLYVVIVPVIYLRIIESFSSLKTPDNTLEKRILVTILTFSLSLFICFLPIIVMFIGPDSVGRASAFYHLFVDTLFGLFLCGAMMGYSIALFAWCMSFGLFRLWSK